MSRRSLAALVVVLAFCFTASAQRPRAITNDSTQPATVTPPPPPPSTVNAKYEGGVFGYPHKKSGTLTIDESNNRLTFRDDKKKELFSIPFNSLTGAYGDTHSVQPKAATVISNVPTIFALPAHFVKTKVRYLTLQYDDPDSDVSGTTSFKLDNQQLLESVLYAVANKAGLTQRGQVYVRKKE
jgi:hypothetical protein